MFMTWTAQTERLSQAACYGRIASKGQPTSSFSLSMLRAIMGWGAGFLLGVRCSDEGNVLG